MAIAGADVGGGSTDNCGIQSLVAAPSAFTCSERGANTVTLTVTDTSGNTDTCQATVTVEDVTGPVITLRGENPMYVVVGQPYVEPGADASDVCDGVFEVTDIGGDTVNTELADTYVVTYNAQDTSGNPAAELTRTVIVSADILPPVITLHGDNPMHMDCGDDYVEPGYTATDDPEGDITGDVVVGGDVLTSLTPPATYQVTYDVQDSAGNPADQVIRTVIIDDNCPLEVVVLGETDVERMVDDPYTFEVSVVPGSNRGAVHYQWTKNDSGAKVWEPINGADSAAYTIEELAEEDTGQYRCEVCDSVTTIQSATVTLTVAGIGMPLGSALLFGALTVAGAVGGVLVIRQKRQ